MGVHEMWNGLGAIWFSLLNSRLKGWDDGRSEPSSDGESYNLEQNLQPIHSSSRNRYTIQACGHRKIFTRAVFDVVVRLPLHKYLSNLLSGTSVQMEEINSAFRCGARGLSRLVPL